MPIGDKSELIIGSKRRLTSAG